LTDVGLLGYYYYDAVVVGAAAVADLVDGVVVVVAVVNLHFQYRELGDTQLPN
jgi:hypothetical protein